MYLNSLRKNCEQATMLKNKYLYQANQYYPGTYKDYYLNLAKNTDLSACKKHDKLARKNPNYVSRLTTYRWFIPLLKMSH